LSLLGIADQPTRNGTGFNAAMFVKLSEMRHRLLNDAPANAHAANKAPIAMNLPVLLANRMAQIHAPNQNRLVA
jgi:hypothetical protein